MCTIVLRVYMRLCACQMCLYDVRMCVFRLVLMIGVCVRIVFVSVLYGFLMCVYVMCFHICCMRDPMRLCDVPK